MTEMNTAVQTAAAVAANTTNTAATAATNAANTAVNVTNPSLGVTFAKVTNNVVHFGVGVAAGYELRKRVSKEEKARRTAERDAKKAAKKAEKEAAKLAYDAKKQLIMDEMLADMQNKKKDEVKEPESDSMKVLLEEIKGLHEQIDKLSEKES